MVPMLATTSSRFMPMPLSRTVRVRRSRSASIRISSFSSPAISSGWVTASKRRRSSASEPFEISSRRKISLFEYSEWIMMSSSCLVSA